MGQPIVQEISSGDLLPDSKLNSSVPTDSANAMANVRDASLASPFGEKNKDWELAFWRSEMLRRFKTDLLGNLGHELRSPLSSQLGSLDLVLSGLCETQAEIQEFLGAARQSAQNHLQLIIDCIALSRYESPVLPLSPRSISLSTVLKPVEQLLLPIAKDRGLRLEWTVSDVDVLVDPHGCEQIVLGLGMWSLGQLIHGTLSVMVDGMPVTMGNDPKDAVEDDKWNQGPRIVLATTGQLRGESSEHEALYWHVPRMMLEAMGGRLLRSRDGDCQQTLSVQFPANSSPTIP